MTENAVADIGKMPRFGIVEHDASLDFGSVSHHAPAAQQAAAPHIGSMADLGVGPNDRWPLDERSRLDHATGSDDDLLIPQNAPGIQDTGVRDLFALDPHPKVAGADLTAENLASPGPDLSLPEHHRPGQRSAEPAKRPQIARRAASEVVLELREPFPDVLTVVKQPGMSERSEVKESLRAQLVGIRQQRIRLCFNCQVFRARFSCSGS